MYLIQIFSLLIHFKTQRYPSHFIHKVVAIMQINSFLLISFIFDELAIYSYVVFLLVKRQLTASRYPLQLGISYSVKIFGSIK